MTKYLRRALGADKVATSAESALVYASDVTRWREIPSMVVFPETVEDVIEVVKIAAEYGTPITPRGAGTGMSGGAVPKTGGIVLSFERMNRIIHIDGAEKTAIVEPGVITSKLQDEAAKIGLFYPPDPSSYKVCTIGGNIAENAGGLRCLKYGVTSDYVLGTEFVTSKGDIAASGYFYPDGPPEIDLTQILCSSEGTLGIIIKAALKLIPQPTSHITISVEFPSAVEAAQSVTSILNSGCLPCIMELINRSTLKAITKFVPLDISPRTESVLLIEFDEEPDVNLELADKTSEICRSHHSSRVKIAEDEESRENLWKLRRSISPSLSRLASGKINEDIAVPRGRIAELVSFAADLSNELGIIIPVYGHAGDGNLHVNFIFDLEDQKQIETVHKGIERVLRKVVELEGTITGEHGIGLAKRDYLALQFSPEKIAFHRLLKKTFDPDNLFNPGKVLPDETDNGLT